MKQLLKYTLEEEVIGIEYNGQNWKEIHDFVGTENFHFSLGVLQINTHRGNTVVVETGNKVVKMENGTLEVLPNKGELEVIAAPFTEDETDQEGDE